MPNPKSFMQKYIYSEDLPLEARMANMIYLVGVGAASVAMVSRIVMGATVSVVLVILSIICSVVGLMYAANHFRLYTLCRWIAVIVLCDILFPLAYFALGGLDSAMPGYFVLSIVLVFLLTWGKSRVIFLVIHILLAISCYYAGSLPFFARFIADTGGSDRYLDHVQTFVVTGLCIGVVIVFQNRIYAAEKGKVNVARNALFYRDKLLRVVNKVAGMLLSLESEHLEEVLLNAMEVMARCIEADRMYIWKNRAVDGKLHYVQEYEWLSEEQARARGAEADYSYAGSIPPWEEKFSQSKCVNGPLRLLPEEEQNALAPFGIQSILAIPIFLQEKFWGFVSFDDCHSERTFSEDDISILRSGSLLIANAIVRSNNEIILGSRLKQQELMSNISQSFISKDPMQTLIQNALRQMGEFLGVTRILVAVADRETEETHPAYTWFSSDEWKPDPSKTGFKDLIRGAFPKCIPEKGYVPTLYCADIATDYEGRYKIFEIVGLKSFVWAPLYVDENFWGLLSVEECSAKRAWNESDAQLVGTVSSAIAGAVARDIVEKERAAALAKAVQASKAKGDFLSNMSHEMRTPMNAIIGMTAIGKSSKDIEKKDYAFGKIEDASSQLLGVINDILDMSKIEANKLELSPVSFEFEKMLQKVVNVINFRVEERAQSFYVTIDKKIPHTLIGDDQRLAQVITNLLSNSVKFTPEEGTIRLNAQYVREENGLCTIQIDVKDTGIGISAEQQARLFHSFEQAENSTTRKFGGTGLGLAISKRIVEMMGGNIWIESEAGKGSTFCFTIQMRRGAGERRALLNPGVNWSNVRILAVDDEEEIRKYFSDTAQRFGVTCDIAASGEEALALIEKNGRYDIYFIDWKMPGMNGLELSRRIKKDNGENSVVTMISAAEWSAIENQANDAGVDKFLSKPLFPSDIADLINISLGLPDPTSPRKKQDGEIDDFAGRCVLLAEDVEINREIVLALLEPTALSIECAQNGEEAVRMFSETPDKYDMIFMDVQMPEMDGYEATRRIRALNTPKSRQIPIVAMTANVFREDIERALSSGMNDHVGKPLDFDNVLEKLRTYLPHKDAAGTKLIKYGEAENEDSGDWEYGIAWSPDLETGNKDIDSQHKQIFRLTSSLAAACVSGQGSGMLGETLEFLASYTIRHFTDEENLQLEYGYPGYEEHKKLHDEFKITVAALSARYKTSGSSEELLEKVNSVIARWLVQHIKQEDSKIAAHIRSRDSTRTTP
jgi:hemerythrin-like metal-binding protein